MNGLLTTLSGKTAQVTGAAVLFMLTATCCYLWATGSSVPDALALAWGTLAGVGVGYKIPSTGG